MTSRVVLMILFVYHLKHVLTTKTERNEQQTNLLDPNSITNVNQTLCAEFNIYKNIFEEMNSPNHPKIQAYYNKVVQKLYESMPANMLILQLWQIYKNCDPSTFVTMVRAQLSLFWLHNMNEYPDNDYVLLAANGFYKIKKNSLYATLNRRTSLLFERALKSLPNSLHYLFGHREFCLLNNMYSEIMYQTDSEDFIRNHEIRFGFTWHFMKKFGDDKGIIIPIFEESNFFIDEDDDEDGLSDELFNITTPLNVALYSKQFDNFYSRWPSYEHKIGGNISVSQHILQQELHVWSVQLVNDDQLVFLQNDHIMCATTFYDNKSRFIIGLKNRTVNDADCQWSAGKCDRR